MPKHLNVHADGLFVGCLRAYAAATIVATLQVPSLDPGGMVVATLVTCAPSRPFPGRVAPSNKATICFAAKVRIRGLQLAKPSSASMPQVISTVPSQ